MLPRQSQKRRHAMRRALAAITLCALLLGTTSTTALAGEITGKGKSLKQPDGGLHGKSACAFSGLNDTYSGDPDVADADGFYRTQSWGQIDQPVREILTAIGFAPGAACNPTIGEPEH
jgi:hypothetical protein